jgi:hypothetical protein
LRLDHPLLRLPVAALDRLRELDLLGRRQQPVPPGLPQEELQRVGRRLPGGLERRRRRLRRPVALGRVGDDLDPARLELAVDRVRLERVEAERLEHLAELRLAHGALLLGSLDEACEIVGEQQDVRLARHPRSVVSAPPPAKTSCTRSGITSSRSAPGALARKERRFRAVSPLNAPPAPG